MTTSGFLLGLPRADTLPGRPAYPSLQPMPRAARASKTTAAVVMQNSDEPPEDLMSMDQHELETAHSRALIDAHDLKRSVLLLDYDDECTVLARAKFNDAMERVVQIEVRGFERYGSGSLGGATRPIPKPRSEGTVLPSEHGPGALGMMS